MSPADLCGRSLITYCAPGTLIPFTLVLFYASRERKIVIYDLEMGKRRFLFNFVFTLRFSLFFTVYLGNGIFLALADFISRYNFISFQTDVNLVKFSLKR